MDKYILTVKAINHKCILTGENSMYEAAIKLLEEKGIKLQEGLTEGEFDKLLEIYGIEFPNPLKEFLKRVLPISDGFYNWRDFRNKNITFIKEMVEYPFVSIYNLAEEVYWCDDWGDKPAHKNERIKIIHEKLVSAPKLIPIYSHRYMPVCKIAKYPIVSIHGVDIVYYGESLIDYIEIEFGNRKQGSIEYSMIEPVAFWSDIM